MNNRPTISKKPASFHRFPRLVALVVFFAFLSPCFAASVTFQGAQIISNDSPSTAATDGLPTQEVVASITEPSHALILDFNASALEYPLHSALLKLAIKKTDKVGKISTAVDVYLLDPSAPLPKPSDLKDAQFAASGVIGFWGGDGALDLALTAAINAQHPKDHLRLALVPVGDAQRSPVLQLAAKPSILLGERKPEFPGVEELMRPLWKAGTTRDESTVFFRQNASDPAKARLLYPPEKISRVVSYATGCSYVEGKDWSLNTDGTLQVLPGSSIPTVADSELHPADGAKLAKGRASKTLDQRNLLSNEGSWGHSKALWVTYSHRSAWTGPVPVESRKELPQTFERLQNKKPLRVIFYGDSITVGASATSRHDMPPYQPSWPDLFVATLRDHYKSPILAKNRALGGSVSQWGATNAATLVAPEKPDLCIISFGMNDRAFKVPTETFRTNLLAIMETIRKANPQAEFILISSILNNPEWQPTEPLWSYLKVMRELVGPGVALVDMTTVDKELLKYKSYIDMSGNNVNHPNDYLIRWYAQSLAGVLCPLPQ